MTGAAGGGAGTPVRAQQTTAWPATTTVALPERVCNSPDDMVRSERGFRKRPCLAELSWWVEDEVRQLRLGQSKTIGAHLLTRGGGTWSFVDCGRSYEALKIPVKSWLQLEYDNALR